MNLEDIFTADKPLQTKNLFTAAEGVTAIHIKAGAELKEHVTRNPAFLICVSGEVIFENEKSIIKNLVKGDFLTIEPGVKHWLKGIADSNLLLIK